MLHEVREIISIGGNDAEALVPGMTPNNCIVHIPEDKGDQIGEQIRGRDRSTGMPIWERDLRQR